MIHNIKSDKLTVRINDFGAELISARGSDDFEYIWYANPTYWDQHAPVLFPICGRILNGYYLYDGKKYEMAGHGFASARSFKVKTKSENSITLVLESDESTLAEYPFDFVLTATYTVIDNTLTADFKVDNKDKKVMPYMFGWHPGFNLPTNAGQDTTDYEIDVKTDKLSWTPMSENGVFYTEKAVEYALPTGAYRLNPDEIYPNDTMIFKGHKNYASMSAKGHPYKLTMTWSDNLPSLCIWKEPKDETKFICIEPWSDYNTDGINDANFDKRKVEILAPKSEASYFFNLKITE